MKQYSKYKNSGIDWLGNIPEHWEVKRVKDVVRYKTGGTPEKKEGINEDFIGYPWITAQDFSENSYIPLKSQFISNDAVSKYGYKLFPYGSILLMCIASVGKVCIAQEDCYTNQQITALIPIIKSIKSKYLYYFFKFASNKIATDASCNVVPIISSFYLNTIYFPLPPLSEQTSIAAYLDEKTANIDRRIELLRNKIDNYKQLRRSLISQVVIRGLNPDVKLKNSGIEWLGDVPEHWDVKRVKDCFEMNPFTSFQGITQNDEISFVPMECIRMGVIEKRIEVFSKISGGSYTPFQNGDILVSKVTPCFENGNIAIADDLLNGKGLGTSEIFVFRPIKMHTKFAFYLFVSDYIKNQGCKTMKGVGGLKRITPIDFYTESIPVPSYTEQTAIAAYLDDKTAQIDSIIGKCEKQIEQLSALRRSLIAEAVTGKIKVC